MSAVELVGRSWLNGRAVNLPHIHAFGVSMDEGQHDMFTIVMSQGAAAVIESLGDAPIEMEATGAGRRGVYHGYVDVTAPQRQVGTADTHIQVLGATTSLKSATVRSWKRRSVADIAGDILRPHKLGLEVDAAETVDYLSQLGSESDWNTLRRLAEKVGFSLVVNDLVVRLIDTSKEYGRARASGASVFAIPSKRSTAVSAISSFRTSNTSNPDGGYRDVKMFGSDRLGQRFEYRVSFEPSAGGLEPTISTVHTDTFTSLHDSILAARRVRRQSRWTQTATVLLTGFRSEMEVGRCVLIVDNDGPHGGYWYVSGVRHSFKDELSSTTATLCRMTASATPASAVSRKSPGVRLSNGAWSTQKAWEVRL